MAGETVLYIIGVLKMQKYWRIKLCLAIIPILIGYCVGFLCCAVVFGYKEGRESGEY